jgi:orotidine-5'-phosphate decarboxylase
MPALANPIFCAIDRRDLDGAVTLARDLAGLIGGVKLGLEFFTAQGPDGVRAVAGTGLPVFLDLKLHDIPNTVAGAVRSAASLGARYLTLHASGGPAMLEAAAAAAAVVPDPPRLLAITVLTSLDREDLARVGVRSDVLDQALLLASLALSSGIDGVVCSPLEVGQLRAALGADPLIAVPGIRPAESGAGDQKRVTTPAAAIAAGADLLVIGRPITGAPDPVATVRGLLADIDGGSAGGRPSRACPDRPARL